MQMKHKEFGLGIKINEQNWDDFLYKLYNHINKGYKLSKRSKLFKELSMGITSILIDKHMEAHKKALENLASKTFYHE